MSKRIGANNRKKLADRRSKARVGMRVFLKKGSIAAVVLVVLIVAGAACVKGVSKAFSALDGSSWFTIKSIQIKGASGVSAEEIMKRSGLKEGMKLYKIQTKSAESAILADSRISDAKIIRKSNGLVVLKIKERTSIALVNLGKIYNVDKTGILFPLAAGTTSNLPLISGVKDTIDRSGRHELTWRDLTRVVGFLDEIGRHGDAFLNDVSQLDFSDCCKVKISMQSHPTLIEVSDLDIDERLRQLKSIEYLLEDNTTAPVRINLCYSNMAFVKGNVVARDETAQSVSD